MEGIAAAILGGLPKLEGKTLLLKTAYTSDRTWRNWDGNDLEVLAVPEQAINTTACEANLTSCQAVTKDAIVTLTNWTMAHSTGGNPCWALANELWLVN